MLNIQYDQAANPTQINYNGNPIHYRYDDFNRLIKIIDEDNQSFSEADITAHIVTMSDDYLGVPDRSKVKVLRESEYVEETLP